MNRLIYNALSSILYVYIYIYSLLDNRLAILIPASQVVYFLLESRQVLEDMIGIRGMREFILRFLLVLLVLFLGHVRYHTARSSGTAGRRWGRRCR